MASSHEIWMRIDVAVPAFLLGVATTALYFKHLVSVEYKKFNAKTNKDGGPVDQA